MSDEPKSCLVDCYDSKGDVAVQLELYPLSRKKKPTGSAASNDLPALLEEIDEREAKQLGEARVQLRENGRYRCVIKDLLPGTGRELQLDDNALIDDYDVGDANQSLIQTRSSAGSLSLKVVDSTGAFVARGVVEIRSIKLNYREEFRGMVKGIAEDARELLFELGAATEFAMQSTWSKDPPTLMQQVEFLRSLLYGGGLWKPLDRILQLPHERLESEPERRPIARLGRVDSRIVRQLVSGQPRDKLPCGHPLLPVMKTVPAHVQVSSRVRTVDTPENRFVKHALKDMVGFLQHAIDILETERANYQLVITDCERLKSELNLRLQKSLFRQLEPPRVLPLGSPVLQRKAGYREVFQTWLSFKASSRLQWEGAEDVFGGGETEYQAGKKDLPTLYESWLFFRLLKLFSEKFDLNYDDVKQFFLSDVGELGRFTLKRGHMQAFGGANKHGVQLYAQFRYNHSFVSKGKTVSEESSWTQVLRPDYTMTFWPKDESAATPEAALKWAEEKDLAVHIHFDAKYRVNSVEKLFGKEEDLDEEGLTKERRKEHDGNHNRADLMKMHAYRDAIRRSEGAYVLYPGLDDPSARPPWRGFHEILPGLGAFAVRPSQEGEAIGMEAVGDFLDLVIQQLTNRATQLAHKRYHQREETSGGDLKVEEGAAVTLVNQIIDEIFADDPEKAFSVPAHEVVCLCGVVKGEAHREWVKSKKLYNFRYDEGTAGYLPRCAPRFAEAKILILRDEEGNILPGLWRISGNVEGWSKEDLDEMAYPDAGHAHYAVYEIEPLMASATWICSKSKLERLRMGALPSDAVAGSPFQFTLKALLAAEVIDSN